MKTQLRTTRIQRDPLYNFEQEMKLRNFSKNTIHSYLYYITELLKITSKSPREINADDVKAYLVSLADGGFSASTLNCAYSALKFYFEKVLQRKFFVNLPRAKKEKKLPVVLAKKEIEKMIDVTSNQKHKCILSMLYGCGLRISEVVKIKMSDIDCEQMMLRVRQAKGNKDRRTILPEKIITILNMQKKIKKADDYLFTSRDGQNPLNVMSVNKIVKQATDKAGINKNVSAHSLRHSFATHLLENNVNIRYIQELLGHARLETTQIYTKVTNPSLKNIKSPL